MKKGSSTETKGFWRLYHLAMREGEIDEAIRVSRYAIKEYRKRDRFLLGIWRRSLAKALFFKGSYERAVSEAWSSYVVQDDRYEKMLSLIAQATPLSFMGREQEALDKLKYAEQQAIKYFNDDAYLWAHLHGTRAQIYKRVGRLDDAAIDWEGATFMCEELGQYWRAAAHSNNEAWLYLETGHLHNAEALINRAIRLLMREPHPHTQACIQDTLGYLHLLQGDYKRALNALMESHRLFERIGDKPQLIGTLLHLSELFERKHSWIKAKGYAKEALALATEIADPKLIAQAGYALNRLPSLTLVEEVSIQ